LNFGIIITAKGVIVMVDKLIADRLDFVRLNEVQGLHKREARKIVDDKVRKIMEKRVDRSEMHLSKAAKLRKDRLEISREGKRLFSKSLKKTGSKIIEENKRKQKVRYEKAQDVKRERLKAIRKSKERFDKSIQKRG
jgi:hypothetical protein